MGRKGLSSVQINNLLSRARKDPYVAVKNRLFARHEDLSFLFFDQCDDEAFFHAREALERGFIARKVGRDSRNIHSLARGICILSSAYRIKGLDDDALLCLDEAQKIAGDCCCCLADIYRRRGILELWQKKYERAYSLLSLAVERSEGREDADGVGRALVSRGISLVWLARIDEGLQDFNRALKLLSDESPQCYHIGAVINIASALAVSEERNQKTLMRRYREALSIIEDLRNKMRGKTEYSRVRPTLRWIEGLVCAKTAQRRRAFNFLRSAKRGFIRLGMNREALAISADIVCLYKEQDNDRNDDQVIEIAHNCLEKLEPTESERAVLLRLVRDPSAVVAKEFRDAVPCAVPSLI